MNSGLLPNITKPTRLTHNSSTLIDNVLTSEIYSSRSALFSFDISDHEAIIYNDPQTQINFKQEYKLIRESSKKALRNLATKFLEGNFEEILEVQDTNDAFDQRY